MQDEMQGQLEKIDKMRRREDKSGFNSGFMGEISNQINFIQSQINEKEKINENLNK